MTDSNHQYKVVRVADKYGLTGIKEELEVFWTQEEDSKSLRELATYFNKHVLRTAMDSANMDTLEGEVANIYRLLTDAQTSSGVRTEVRKKLEHNGIDVDQLESDFVTYQAIRTYLQEEREVTYERKSDAERIESVSESIARLQNRTVNVTREKLAQLEQTERVNLGDFRVLLDLRVFCEDCETQYNVNELLEKGGCECSSPPTE